MMAGEGGRWAVARWQATLASKLRLQSKVQQLRRAGLGEQQPELEPEPEPPLTSSFSTTPDTVSSSPKWRTSMPRASFWAKSMPDCLSSSMES